MNKKLIVSLVLCFSFNTFANPLNPQKISADKIRSSLILNSSPQLNHHHKKTNKALEESLSQDAIDAVMEAENAILASAKKDGKSAKKALTKANFKLQKLMAKNPDENSLLAVDFELEIMNFAPAELNAIEKMRGQIDVAYKRGDLPETRYLMNGLISEIQVTTFNVSSADFSKQLKEASKLISDKKFDEASALLSNSLNTLTVQEWRVPIPFIEAEAQIVVAEKHKGDNVELTKRSLEMAEIQLERALALGYVVNEKENFNSLKKHIMELKNQIHNKEERMKRFGIIKEELIAFINRFRAPKKVSRLFVHNK